MKKHNRGFTVIETLVYLGLFAILFGGAVVAAYGMIEGNSRGETSLMLQTEGDFLLNKINWALSGVKSVEVPAVGATESSLSVTKWTTTLNPVVMSLSSGTMQMSTQGSVLLDLNNTNTVVENLSFTQIYSGGTDPKSVRFSFTLKATTPNGMVIEKVFRGEKYLRK